MLHFQVQAVRLLRTLYFLPSVLSGVAVTLLWVLIFNPRVGALNAILDWFGIKGPGWLTDPDWALIALAIISLWGIGHDDGGHGIASFFKG